MTRFLLRRSVQALLLLLVISLLVFVLLHAAPGGPLAIYLSNPNVRPEDIERLRRALGLDRPVWQQYVSWLGAFARGDWGYSFSDGRPVVARIVERVPATLELVGVAMAGALALTLPAGIVSAANRGSWIDRTVGAAAMAGISVPAFWFGLLLQIVFAIALGVSIVAAEALYRAVEGPTHRLSRSVASLMAKRPSGGQVAPGVQAIPERSIA